MTLQSEGIGYDDLNDFLKNPCDLQFTIGKYCSVLPLEHATLLMNLRISKS